MGVCGRTGRKVLEFLKHERQPRISNLPPGYFRNTISVILAAAIAQAHCAPALAQATPRSVTQEDYEACQAGDEQAFQAAIEKITISAMKTGLQGTDYVAAVDTQWRALGMDAIIDKRVDIAVKEVQDETSLGTRIQSLGNKEKAQELATKVAERVYRSQAVTGAIEKLAEGVGKSIGDRIELASQDAAAPALECLQAFLGKRYGRTVADVVSGNAATEFGLDPDKATASISAGSVLKRSSGGITGAAILIVRRQLANMARRIGQRIVGAVLSRLVSVVAGGIGLVLIAKDIWDLRNGVLPIIGEEMKAPATKQMVRQELAKSLSEQIAQHVNEIGSKAAKHVVEVWREFRRAHLKALELADSNETFRAFLRNVSPTAFARLDEVVSLVLRAEGEKGILERLDDGTLTTAVHKMPEPAMTIARELRAIEPALKWSAISGDNLDKVVSYEIYRRNEPQSFSQVSLSRLFEVDNRLAVTRLAALNRAARDTLFELQPAPLKSLARALSEPELETLAAYLTGLKEEPRKRVLEAVAADPVKMRKMAPVRVRKAILASSDQSAAIDMFLRTPQANTATQVFNDFVLAWEGRISPLLIWERHPLATVLLGLVLLFGLLILRRLLFPRKRKPPTPPSTPPEDASQPAAS